MNNNSNSTANKRRHKRRGGDDEEEDDDPEVWATFNTTFRQVQSVLDRNRNLIQQVNDNHQSRVPDNMVKNVALIQELNSNISKVSSLYSDLSSNFSSSYQNSHGGGSGASGHSNSSGRS